MRALVAGTCVMPLLALAACQASVVPGATVVDSAGVRVTMSEPADLVFAALDSLPILSLGARDATGPTQFQGIQGMHVDRDGRIWVTHVMSPELRIFESDGAYWKTRGGRGQGPGEFGYARVLGAARGDSVLVADLGLRRLSVFDANGEFVRTEPLPEIDDSGLLPPLHVFGDGSILGQVPRMGPRGASDVGQIFSDSVDLVRIDLSASSIHPFRTIPEPLAMGTADQAGEIRFQSQVPFPFTARVSFDVEGDEVHLVWGPDFRVRVFDEAGLREVYGIARVPRPVGDHHIEAYRTFVQEYAPSGLEADLLAALDHESRPDRLPAYDRVLRSSDGHTWAQIYDPDLWAPRDWDVFDAEGRFAGQVHVENQFYPMVIDQEAVFGVWQDTLGLEQVRAYAFTRP